MYPPHQSVSSSGWATTTATRGRVSGLTSSSGTGVIVFLDGSKSRDSETFAYRLVLLFSTDATEPLDSSQLGLSSRMPPQGWLKSNLYPGRSDLSFCLPIE